MARCIREEPDRAQSSAARGPSGCSSRRSRIARAISEDSVVGQPAEAVLRDHRDDREVTAADVRPARRRVVVGRVVQRLEVRRGRPRGGTCPRGTASSTRPGRTAIRIPPRVEAELLGRPRSRCTRRSALARSRSRRNSYPASSGTTASPCIAWPRFWRIMSARRFAFARNDIGVPSPLEVRQLHLEELHHVQCHPRRCPRRRRPCGRRRGAPSPGPAGRSGCPWWPCGHRRAARRRGTWPRRWSSPCGASMRALHRRQRAVRRAASRASGRTGSP